MRKIILKEGETLTQAHLQRKSAFNAQAMEIALGIVEEVRQRGDEALIELTEKYDGVPIESLRVSQDKLNQAAAKCAPHLSNALERAAAQIREFHERQLEQSWFSVREDGALVGVKVTPLDSVGVYVPGGRALYPSSLLMNALPASVAGVKRIVVVNPPLPNGGIDSAIAKACELANVTEVYQVGGAQAIAALAYGTNQIVPVDKITGPGNTFVAAAKMIVSGDVGIDMIAGPSEVCVVADDEANPALVAIDLMAQAEHDPLATCYLVTLSNDFANQVEAAIDEYMKATTRAEITSESLGNYGLIIVCAHLSQAFEVVNTIAPEHLELHLAYPMHSLGTIRHAGAIFLGEFTPEAVGDYVAGPNHTLPTAGTARFSSPLAVEQFIKKSSIIQYSEAALAADASTIIAIANHEGLWAHARSVEMRNHGI